MSAHKEIPPKQDISGKTAFLTGAALICIPRGLTALHAFIMDLPWFFPSVGAALSVNLAYCTWRGERWAYYLLLFLCVAGLNLSVVLLLAAGSTGPLALGILEILGVTIGANLIAFHPGSKEFMELQRIHHSTSVQEHQKSG